MRLRFCYHKKEKSGTILLRSAFVIRLMNAYSDFPQQDEWSSDTPATRSELALTCCFRLLLALHGRLLIMLSLANFRNHAVFCTGTLETLQSGIQGFVLANANFCHEFFPPFVQRQRLYMKEQHCIALHRLPYTQLIR